MYNYVNFGVNFPWVHWSRKEKGGLNPDVKSCFVFFNSFFVWMFCSFKQSIMPCGVPVPVRCIYQQEKWNRGTEGHFPQLTGETAEEGRPQRTLTNFPDAFWTVTEKEFGGSFSQISLSRASSKVGANLTLSADFLGLSVIIPQTSTLRRKSEVGSRRYRYGKTCEQISTRCFSPL